MALLKQKTFKVHSDKIQFSVVDLTHIDLAAEEDKRYHIDEWTALFKAAAWEEIKMPAQDNDSFKEASKAYDQPNQEKSARQVREAWDDFFRVQRSVQSQLEHQQTIISSQEAELEALKIQLHEKDALIAELQAQNDALKARLK